jgi:hypothetical protein
MQVQETGNNRNGEGCQGGAKQGAGRLHAEWGRKGGGTERCQAENDGAELPAVRPKEVDSSWLWAEGLNRGECYGLPYVRMGKALRLRWSEVQRYLETLEIQRSG